MALQTIGPDILAWQPVGELRETFARTDIIAIDLDECIFPGYSQTELGARIAWRLLRRPKTLGERRFLPRLVRGGAFFALREMKRFFGFHTPTTRLVTQYERTLRGVPERYLREEATKLPRRSFTFAAETVALLASHAPTGIISLGLDVVMEAYMRQFRSDEGPSLSYFDANVVAFRPGKNGEHVFGGYDWSRLMADGADKCRALRRRMAEFGATVPTTVGHSDDDVDLARLTRELGGLAIGFCPPRRLWDAFDAIVTGRDWGAMYALAAILAGPP